MTVAKFATIRVIVITRRSQRSAFANELRELLNIKLSFQNILHWIEVDGSAMPGLSKLESSAVDERPCLQPRRLDDSIRTSHLWPPGTLTGEAMPRHQHQLPFCDRTDAQSQASV